jgi:hypothetical protein
VRAFTRKDFDENWGVKEENDERMKNTTTNRRIMISFAREIKQILGRCDVAPYVILYDESGRDK